MKITHHTAPTEYLEVDGVRYAYRRLGPRTCVPLVMLQHFRGGLDHWDPCVTDGLAEDRPVILFNNAGVCSSGGTPADNVPDMAGHVIKFITALKLNKVDLLGFSIGGFVAQQVTIQRPDLVRKLVLVGTGPEGGAGMVHVPEVAEHATRAVPNEQDFLYLFFGPSETSQSAGKAFWKRRHERHDQDSASSPEAMRAQGNAIAAWGIVPARGRYESIRNIRQPVLVVNGDKDIVVPTVNSYILQQNIPDATLIIYPDSGHGALFQYASRFVSHARQFLNS